MACLSFLNESTCRHLDHLFDELRGPHHFSLGIHAGMDGVACGGKPLAVVYQDAVVKFHSAFNCWVHLGLDGQNIVVPSWGYVFASNIRHREQYPFFFNLFIGEIQRPKHLRSANFKPAKVVGIVDDPHVVGVAVYYSVLGGVNGHGFDFLMASLPKRYYALVIEFFDPSNIFAVWRWFIFF
jgi:hypothetical protein